MRFVVTGEWNRNSLLRVILLLFLVYVALFWITDWVLWFQKMTLSPDSITAYYLGDTTTEFGRPARPLGAIAEVSHFHLFAMGMLVMTLTHLLLFLPIAVPLKIALVCTTFFSALVNEGSIWLIRYVHPDFAWLKLGAFLLLQVALLGLLVALAVGIVHPGRNAYTDTQVARH
jgi:hypothetical protein